MNSFRFHSACSCMLLTIYGLPACFIALLASALSGWWNLPVIFVAPLLYAILFAVTAGLMSWPFHKAIMPGKFPRDLQHQIYRKRRYYGLCWTALYYCKPVYYLCLSLPWLKWLTFRLFGYRGQLDFTLYPDTWIRDLPLLELGKGAYVANRATLGTNMPLKNGKVLVDHVKVGDGAYIGHLTMLAAGVEVGDHTEIESGCALGLRVKVGSGCSVGGTVTLNHYARLGNDINLGTSCYVGFRSRVEDGVEMGGFAAVRDNCHFPAERREEQPVN
jgi:carbonic anhydrase/acetyltransferase-like protein (isoleucine patch superfamily)